MDKASSSVAAEDMMKRVLTDSIFADDPLAYYVPYREKPQTAARKRRAVAALRSFLTRYRIHLVEPYFFDKWTDSTKLDQATIDSVREGGTRWPARAHTMIGMKRLNNLQYCCETVIREGIPGDLVP